MAHEKIFIVEDEADIMELHRYNLEKEGYRVEGAANGEEAMRKIKTAGPDLIILDLLLPGMDGLELCRYVKQDNALRAIPVIMVTAKGEDADIITGLEMGADDYVTKPFSPRVLIARIRNVLRRKKQSQVSDEIKEIKIHGITINREKYEVRTEKGLLELTATEFGLLRLFCENPGIVLSRSRIINAVKGDNYPVTERAVDVQILGLRRKLGAQGKYIKTVRGIGYRFKEE